MKNLNRKTIPVCRSCHKKIHKGTYDRHTLKNIYDIELTQVYKKEKLRFILEIIIFVVCRNPKIALNEFAICVWTPRYTEYIYLH
jgi:hypothetical protein